MRIRRNCDIATCTRAPVDIPFSAFSRFDTAEAHGRPRSFITYLSIIGCRDQLGILIIIIIIILHNV